MGYSRSIKEKLDSFSLDEIDRLIRMGWEDRTPFEAIERQFGLTENDFVHLMRRELPASAFSRWRKRIHHRGYLKHEKKRGFKNQRFKCSRQSIDGLTKGWK